MSGTHGYWVTKQRNRILHNAKPDDSEGHTTELFTQWSADFIRKSVAQKKPFFCYLAYNAVHGPIRTDESKPASAPKEWVDKALARGVSFLAPNNPSPLGKGKNDAHGDMVPIGKQVAYGLSFPAPINPSPLGKGEHDLHGTIVQTEQ